MQDKDRKKEEVPRVDLDNFYAFIFVLLFFLEVSHSFHQIILTPGGTGLVHPCDSGQNHIYQKPSKLCSPKLQLFVLHDTFPDSSLLLGMPSPNSQALEPEIVLNGDFQRESQIPFPIYSSGIHSKTMAELVYSPLRSVPLGTLAIIQIRAEPALKSLSVSQLGKKKNLEELTISSSLFVFLIFKGDCNYVSV